MPTYDYNPKRGQILFTTSTGLEYQCIFETPPFDLYDSHGSLILLNIVEFSFHPKGPTGPPDPLIMPTIVKILTHFFTNNPDYIIIYSCSQAKNQQEVRSHLFGKHYQKYAVHPHSKIKHIEMCNIQKPSIAGAFYDPDFNDQNVHLIVDILEIYTEY